MEPNFNINRPKVNDDEINRHKNFDQLVKQFKARSLKQAQSDETWWKNKKIRYSAVIAGFTVVCTITYLSVLKNQTQNKKSHETLITSNPKPSKTKPVQQRCVQPPLKKLNRPYTVYQVNNSLGGQFTHPSTSKIKIPKNAFIDKHGKEIIGDVTILYREFKDVGDFIAAGIPMTYDSAAAHYHLESAGMFDIAGSQNGQPVFIKPNKHIDVALASSNSENRFNQYFLDTVARNWRYLQKDNIQEITSAAKNSKTNSATLNPTSSPALASIQNEIQVLLPKKIDSLTSTYSKKIDRLPTAKEPTKPLKPTSGRPSFKLDGSYNEFPELAAFNNVVFEVGPENNNYSKDINEITWSDIKVTQGPSKGRNYILNLSYRNRQEKLIVYPVLKGSDFDNAQKIYEDKFVEYEALIEKRKTTEKKLLAEMQQKQQTYFAEIKKKQQQYEIEKAKVAIRASAKQQNETATNFNNLSNSNKAIRLFSISQFGVFNSDCALAFPAEKSVHPIFVTNNRDAFIVPDYVYLIDHKTKSVYTINTQNGLNINYNLDDYYTICLFKQNRIYVCNKSSFKQTTEGGSNKFNVVLLGASSENLLDFKKALEI